MSLTRQRLKPWRANTRTAASRIRRRFSAAPGRSVVLSLRAAIAPQLTDESIAGSIASMHDGLPYRGDGSDRPAGLALPPAPMPRRQGRRPLKRWRYVGVYSPD